MVHRTYIVTEPRKLSTLGGEPYVDSEARLNEQLPGKHSNSYCCIKELLLYCRLLRQEAVSRRRTLYLR